MNFLPVMRNTNTNKVKLRKSPTPTLTKIFREVTGLLQFHGKKVVILLLYIIQSVILDCKSLIMVVSLTNSKLVLELLSRKK